MRHCSYFFVLLSLMLMGAASAQLIGGGQTDLAAGAQVIASSSVGTPGNRYTADDAVDGNNATWWAAYNKTPATLEVRFAKPQQVDTIVFLNPQNPNLYSNAKHINISLPNITPLDQELPDDVGPFIIRIAPVTTDSIKLTIMETHDPNMAYLGVAALQVYNDPQKQVRVKKPMTSVWRGIDLTENGRSEHPCVYMTRADVEAARQRIQTEAWAKTLAQSIIKSADQALARPDEWYLKMMPKKGACFAYGFTGCPICKGSWGTWGGARCSWDNPGHVTCTNGHVLPDAEHPDPGDGYKNPDGRIHYMVGSWNAWVIEKFTLEMANSLAQAYSLTGDEKYAEKAAFILDAVADIYPSCDKGSWDYPSEPPSGRLDRPWYQVARVLVRLVDFYDQIYHSPVLDKPSITTGLTRRQNIVENMLKNGAAYCYEQSLHGGLNNGEADYVRGALAVGALLGIDSYVDWAYDGPYGIKALVHNNICRDGAYFETSVMYSDHTRGLYLSYAEPLWNYRSEKYPQGVDLYKDPVFQSFYLLPVARMGCLGHSPRYGDSGPDLTRLRPPAVPADALDTQFAEILYARSSGKTHEDFGDLLSYLCGGDVTRARASTSDAEWMLFHAAPPPQTKGTLPAWLNARINDTAFFGEKGIALLRTPNSPEAQAALIRFGPSLNHGHTDDLNLNYFALGYELTYDLGYGLGSTHTQVGWSHQTASHNLVMVDEKSQGPNTDVDGSGGSLFLLAGLPGLQVSDASAEPTYQSLGVTDYRRLCALIGEGKDTYLLDIFHVKGGKQHDYIFHALSNKVDFAGVQFGAAAKGSLAGEDIDWGVKQGNDGDMIGYPNKPYWNPPPGNGLGFLMEPQRGNLTGPMTATWNIGADDCHLRMTLLPEPDTELITAWAPGIYPERQGMYGAPEGYPRTRYIYARRQSPTPLESTYVAVYEPYAPQMPQGVHDDVELSRIASVTGGEYRRIPSAGVLLFKATGPDDELSLPLKVAKDGTYTISAAVYGSQNYGQASLAIDGQPFQRLLNENNAVNGGTAKIFVLGDRQLKAGEHTFTVRMVKPVEGNYWIGLQYVSISPAGSAMRADQPAKPFLASAARLASPAGTVAVEVKHVTGSSDLLFYNPKPGTVVNCPQAKLSTDAYLARTTGNTFNFVGGSRLKVGALDVKMPQGQLSGTISRVDYQTNRVYTNTKLPTDGRLNGALVYFNNPRYSRNTAYRIERVLPNASGSIIDLGRTSLILGFAELDDDPVDENTIATLNPSEYSRALRRPDSHFFHGKLLATEDLKLRTNIRATIFGQPFTIKVDSSKGFRKDQRVYYYDIQQSDSFTIYNTCSLQAQAGGTMLLTGNSNVTLNLAKPLEAQVGGKWVACRNGVIPWRAEGTLLRFAAR